MRLKGIVLAQAPRGDSSSPRTLLPAQQQVANRPIICHVVDALRDAGAADVAVIGSADSLSHLRDPYPPDLGGVTYIASRSSEDLMGLITAAAPFVGDDPCVIHLADGLAGDPITPVPQLCSRSAPDVGVFVHHGRSREFELGEEIEQLLGIASLDRGKGGLGIAGIGYLGPRALQNACLVDGARRRPTPDLTALAERISAGGGRLHVGRLGSWRRYEGDPTDLLAMNRMVLDRLSATDVGEHRYPDSRIEGRVEIDPTATISDSVISGPVIIGPGAQIVGAYIGPYTSIGANVTIRGAEIERSIVSEGATVKHLAARIEGSTIGRGASVSREFSLPRGVRMHLGDGAEIVLD